PPTPTLLPYTPLYRSSRACSPPSTPATARAYSITGLAHIRAPETFEYELRRETKSPVSATMSGCSSLQTPTARAMNAVLVMAEQARKSTRLNSSHEKP